MNFATTDLCDAHPEVQVCEPVFGDYGGKLSFRGPAKTLKVFEDNTLVRTLLGLLPPVSGNVHFFKIFG